MLQQTPLQTAESLIVSFEQELNNLNQQYGSKQAERIISNHVWMTSVFEEKILPKLNNLKEVLTKIRNEYAGDFKTTTQFDMPVKHCDELHKALSDLLYLYKIRASPIDIKIKMQHTMPLVMNNMSSLKNRFFIVKGNITRGKQIDEEDLFDF